MSTFDEIIDEIDQIINTTHKTTAAPSPPIAYRESAPIPLSFKADVNPKKGEITSWLAMYRDPNTGQPYLDSYLDYTEPGFMSKSISQLKQKRARTNNPYLLLYLWQHNNNDIIGGIKELAEDSQGVLYVAQVNMAVQRGREAFALAEAKMVGGSSYGYTPIRFYNDTKGYRHLVEVDVQEASLVSFPANPHAQVLDAKSRFYVPSGYDRIARLTSKMADHFDTLERQLNSYHSDFPLLPYDEPVGEGEVNITALLASIQREMRRS